MNQREIPGFGYVMDDRYSCLWERWEGKASRCHPMFGSVVAWFYWTLAGIRYDEAEPGMKHIVIAPQPVGGLIYCSGSYQSLYGPVRSDWRIEADSFELTVEVPVNTTATVILPDARYTEMSDRASIGSRRPLCRIVEPDRRENSSSGSAYRGQFLLFVGCWL